MAWSQALHNTRSTFSMMTRYDVRDVGRKDISLGIVTENINMMGSNTFQLLGKRIWWNWRMLLTGTTINENTQDFKQDCSGPSQINYDPHHCTSLSPVIYLVQTQVPQIPNSTQRRQPFLINHLPLAVFSTPLNFKFAQVPNPIIVFYLICHIVHQV